jgi:hypothetical protein
MQETKSEPKVKESNAATETKGKEAKAGAEKEDKLRVRQCPLRELIREGTTPCTTPRRKNGEE